MIHLVILKTDLKLHIKSIHVLGVCLCGFKSDNTKEIRAHIDSCAKALDDDINYSQIEKAVKDNFETNESETRLCISL